MKKLFLLTLFLLVFTSCGKQTVSFVSVNKYNAILITSNIYLYKTISVNKTKSIDSVLADIQKNGFTPVSYTDWKNVVSNNMKAIQDITDNVTCLDLNEDDNGYNVAYIVNSTNDYIYWAIDSYSDVYSRVEYYTLVTKL